MHGPAKCQNIQSHFHATQDDPTDKRILLAFLVTALCEEREPRGTRALYFYIMDGLTGEVILLPDALPVHVITRAKAASYPISSRQEIPAVNSMRTLLSSTRYACATIALDTPVCIFKMFPKKFVDLVAEHKGWSAEATPVKLIHGIVRKTPGALDDATDAFGFCVDYERRDVAKALFRRLPANMCGACGTENGKLRMCAACGVVRYCSPTCQKTDWKDHKTVCAQLKEDSERGLRVMPLRFFERMWE